MVMRVRIVGHAWNLRSGLRPTVLSAAEVIGRHELSARSYSHPCWNVDEEFLSRGRSRVRSASRPWRERPVRTLHIYPPNTPYWEDWEYMRRKDGTRHGAWLTFLGGPEAGLDDLVPPQYGYARFRDPAGILGRVLRRAARAGHQYGEAGFWEAQQALCEVISILLRSEHVAEETYQVPTSDPTSETSEIVQSVEAFLKERLAEKVTLKDIARRLHVSVSTLSHRYRDEADETPMATLARLRIGSAKALLLRGQKLRTVAAQLGFSDAFHLSRTFKRLEGISPRDFLKSRAIT